METVEDDAIDGYGGVSKAPPPPPPKERARKIYDEITSNEEVLYELNIMLRKRKLNQLKDGRKI